MRLSTIILLFALLAGCLSEDETKIPERFKEIKNLTAYPADLEPVSAIKLFPETVFEDTISGGWYDKGMTGVGWFAGLEVDASGRVYIGDISSGLTVHVFDPDGSYMTNLGREGSGPAEFRSIAGMRIMQHHLYVHDSRQLKVTVYSLDVPEFSHVIRIKTSAANQNDFEELTGWFSRQRVIINDSTFLVGFMKHPKDARVDAPTYNLGEKRIRKFFLMDHEGKIISDKIFEQRSARDLVATVGGEHLYNFFPLPFLGKSLRVISDNGQIFTAWTEDFLIRVYDPDGDYQHAFYHPFQQKKLNRGEIVNLFEKDEQNYRTLAQHAELPETWPALNSMVADNRNSLWVSTHVKGHEGYQWWVLDRQGKLLARFTWPKNRRIEEIKDGHLYARKTGEAGLQKIVRYRIEMDGGMD